MPKFAVVETGGKQYRITEGDRIKVEKLNAGVGAKIIFDKPFLVVDGEEVKIGSPCVEKSKIEAKVLNHGKGDKKIVFRYHSKTRYRKKKGHRQPFTEVEITKIY